MDINSKEQTTVSKFKKFSAIINILLIVIPVLILIFGVHKRDALLILALIIFIKVSLVYIFDNFKILMFLEYIREMLNMNYCVREILEKTDEKSEISFILGKKYKKILEKMYQVEKYTYEIGLKGKQSETMTNTVIEDIGKNLAKPVESMNIGIQSLKENINSETLDYIEQEAYKMKNTTNELFELSKAVTKTLDINIEKLDLVSLIKQALIEYEDRLDEKNIEIKKHILSEKIYINADGDKLWRVLEILLDNIFNHGKGKTRVHIEISEKEENIELTLINISKNELNIDINKFYKIINENKNLGIPIAISLIEAQGGKMNIDIDGDMFKVMIVFKKVNDLKNREK
ncbi:MAG: sensor histidine kinase [Paraclostridium sp.]